MAGTAGFDPARGGSIPSRGAIGDSEGHELHFLSQEYIVPDEGITLEAFLGGSSLK